MVDTHKICALIATGLMVLIISTSVEALTESQTAYISGVKEGMALGSLYSQGQNNATAAAEYNEMVKLFNDRLNASFGTEAMVYLLKPIPVSGTMPVVISTANASAEDWSMNKTIQVEKISHTIDGTQKIEAHSGDQLSNGMTNPSDEWL